MLLRVLTLFSILSLTVCVMAIVLWVRSERDTELIGWETQDKTPYQKAVTGYAGLFSYQGRAYFGWTNFRYVDYPFTYLGRRAERQRRFLWKSSPQSTGFYFPPPDPDVPDTTSGQSIRSQWIWKRGGVYLGSIECGWDSGSFSNHALCVPYWIVVTMTLIVLVATKIRFARPWSRFRPGFCSECGYDLRASKDRCPECGVPIGVSTLPDKA